MSSTQNLQDLTDTILAIIINSTGTYEHPSSYLDLLELRNRLDDLEGITPTHSEVDAALLDLHRSGKARLDIEEGFRFLALNPEYAEAGVRVGGEVRHLISISRSTTKAGAPAPATRVDLEDRNSPGHQPKLPGPPPPSVTDRRAS